MPLGFLIFFLNGKGTERRFVVVPIEPYKGDASEIFWKFMEIEKMKKIR